MAIKVLITRRLKEGSFHEAFKLLMELRSLATVRKGYVSGQTLISRDDHNKLLVVSTWSSEKLWEDWRQNKKRINFSKKLEPLLDGPELVEVYLVGEKTPEWVDMA